MSPEFGWALVRRIARLQRRVKDLTTRVAQLERSRAQWRSKAQDRSRALHRANVRARRQHERAELWKHRALSASRASAADTRRA